MARIRSGLGNRVSEFYVFSSGGSQGEMTCGEVVPGEGGGVISCISVIAVTTAVLKFQSQFVTFQSADRSELVTCARPTVLYNHIRKYESRQNEAKCRDELELKQGRI